MKKLTAILLIVVMSATVFCACDHDGNDSDTSVVERGVVSDNTYTNGSLDVTFTKPANWIFYTDDEIAQLMNISAELYKDKNLLQSAKITSVIDFMAIDPATNDNVNMTVENLAPSGNADMTVETYVEIVKNNLKTQMSGATYTFNPMTTVTLGKVEYVKVAATCTMQGTTMTQNFYIKKVGSYMISITATSVDQSKADGFERLFS